MIKTQTESLRFDHAVETPEQSLQARTERPSGPISRVVGLYQTLLRKTLEHFFPNAILEVQGDRSVIDWDGSPNEIHYRFTDDLDGVGLEIEWLGTHLSFRPESPVPLLPLERRMVEVVVQALDRRFRGLFDQDFADRLERFQYLTEDLIITDFLQPVSPYRVPAALEALRVAALSTYQNRRLSTGASCWEAIATRRTPGESIPRGPLGSTPGSRLSRVSIGSATVCKPCSSSMLRATFSGWPTSSTGLTRYREPRRPTTPVRASIRAMPRRLARVAMSA